MAISKAGLNQIVACDLGKLKADPPVDPIAMGIRGPASFKRGHYKPLKDYLDGQWRNMMNFELKAESMQSTMFMLDKMIQWLNGNVDVQFTTVKQACDGNPDCYQFEGDNKFGLEFEYEISSDKRIITPTFEVALPWTAGKTLVDSADSVSPVDFSDLGYPRGENQTYLRRPYFIAFEAPKSTAVLTRDELISRSYKISTVGKKSDENNMSLVDYLLFELVLKFRNASVANQITVMSKNMAPSIYIKEGNDSTYYDAFDFNAGVLTMVDDFEDNDEERALTLTFKRRVFLCDLDFNYGVSFGGTAIDNGTLGGTLKIGYPEE